MRWTWKRAARHKNKISTARDITTPIPDEWSYSRRFLYMKPFNTRKSVSMNANFAFEP